MESMDDRVDPMERLPPELLLQICLLLPPGDRAKLLGLSKGWRAFAADEALWRDVHLALDDGNFHYERADLHVLRAAPCVGSVKLNPWNPMRPYDSNDEALIEALGKAKKVRKLTGVPCSYIEEAVPLVLPLLQRLAPHLEGLELCEPMVEHLQVVAGMPALRWLRLRPVNLLNTIPIPPRTSKRRMGRKQSKATPCPLPPLPPQLHHLELQQGPQLLPLVGALAELRVLKIDMGYEGTTVYKKENGVVDPDEPTVALPPRLEELTVRWGPNRGDLRAALQLPSLRKLSLRGSDLDWVPGPVVECPLPAPGGPGGLRLLQAPLGMREDSANATVVSILRAHAATLEELVIAGGLSAMEKSPETRDSSDEDDDDDGSFWRDHSLKVVRLLQSLGLKVLRRLVLVRRERDCRAEACAAQLQALREVFRPRDVLVQCHRCRRRTPGFVKEDFDKLYGIF